MLMIGNNVMLMTGVGNTALMKVIPLLMIQRTMLIIRKVIQ